MSFAPLALKAINSLPAFLTSSFIDADAKVQKAKWSFPHWHRTEFNHHDFSWRSPLAKPWSTALLEQGLTSQHLLEISSLITKQVSGEEVMTPSSTGQSEMFLSRKKNIRRNILDYPFRCITSIAKN